MRPKKILGFTLIEIVVVVGVISAIAAILLANFPRFNKVIAIDREASRLALTLRKAQSYSLAVREFGQPPAYKDNPGCDAAIPTLLPVRFPPYGVSISRITNGVLGPGSYVIFGDINCSKYYDDTVGDETVEIARIERAQITSISGFGGALCGSGCNDIEQADINYKRPSPSITINGISGLVQYEDLERVEVIIKIIGEDLQKKIIIRSTGQISVE